MRDTTLLVMICMLGVTLSLSIPGCNATTQPPQHTFLFTAEDGTTIRLQRYKDAVVRVQYARPDEEFFADDRYGMVEQHLKGGAFHVEDQGAYYDIAPSDARYIIRLEKRSLGVTFTDTADGTTLVANGRIRWEGEMISTHFVSDPAEHFCGVGHGSFGRVESLDLRGKRVHSNYGGGESDDYGRQAVLTVPFYLSSKGYGIFLNSTFRHLFNFGEDDMYGFGIDTKGFAGRMDYFFIHGPEFRDILDSYTRLTGRPRLPPKSIFGLQLSDKGDPQHEGAQWWYDKVAAHRAAGYPFDHIVFDNRWRAGTGAWSGSWFEWDSTRFPDPEAFGEWVDSSHLTITLDLNRNVGAASYGWKPEYNFPHSEEYVKEGFSAPDYSNPEVRNWVWDLFWTQSLNPALNYPGDALWIDETDELYPLPDTIICADGRSWAENNNYYQFLVAKGIVGEGWDNSNDNAPPGIEDKRPYVWVRGATAGGQRYATHWTGDLECDYTWMRQNIRGMLASGLSGFPYFNHDAGGFRPPGPDDAMYRQWAMAFGSFSPIWRPHGPGENKRWPLDRSPACQKTAHRYAKLRYELMPYIYTLAHEARATGLPMARAMVIDYRLSPQAWSYDLQYLWGEAMLVAPATSGQDTLLNIWLPGNYDWYNFWTGLTVDNGEIVYATQRGELPIFVKAGAVIPGRAFAQSTSQPDPSLLKVHVYTGADGAFKLVEDDGISQQFTDGELMTTRMEYFDPAGTLTIFPATGMYEGAPEERQYVVHFHGIRHLRPVEVEVGGEAMTIGEGGQGLSIHLMHDNNVLIVRTHMIDLQKKVEVTIKE